MSEDREDSATGDPFADKRDWWKYLQATFIGGTNHLKQALPVDEANFRFVSGSSHHDARAYFLYEALDEVQKTGIAISRWVELLEPGQEFSWSDDLDEVSRLVLEAVLDEQRLRVRKLVEILIALINFETTNEDAYYRHYLLLAELQRLLSSQSDVEEFYGQPSDNVAYATELTRHRLDELRRESLDESRAWYAGSGRGPGQVFRSTRNQLKRALAYCTDAERAVLGFTYGTFSSTSQDVHFSVTGTSPTLSWDDMAKEIGRTGLLGLTILIRCQRLTGIIPDGLNRQLRDIFETNEVPTEHVQRVTQGSVEVGDFVVVMGALAEVVDMTESSYGYRSFKITYLADHPIPSIETEWHPAFAVRLLYNRETLIEKSTELAADGSLPSEVAEILSRRPAEDQQSALRESLLVAWDAGLREALGQRKRRLDRPSH